MDSHWESRCHKLLSYPISSKQKSRQLQDPFYFIIYTARPFIARYYLSPGWSRQIIPFSIVNGTTSDPAASTGGVLGMEVSAHLLLRAGSHYPCPVLLWPLKQSGIEEMDFHITLATGSGYCWRVKDGGRELRQHGFILMVYWFHLVKAY